MARCRYAHVEFRAATTTVFYLKEGEKNPVCALVEMISRKTARVMCDVPSNQKSQKGSGQYKEGEGRERGWSEREWGRGAGAEYAAPVQVTPGLGTRVPSWRTCQTRFLLRHNVHSPYGDVMPRVI